MIPEIHIEDYNYGLDDTRIAKYPLPQRDASKLLHYKEGKVEERIFRDLPELLPNNALMVFNDTKVVPARLHFQRETGAHIEIFCLEPIEPVEYNTAFASTTSTTWKCVIGNAKKWHGESLELRVENLDLTLCATKQAQSGNTFAVRFEWNNDRISFAEILDAIGELPIPPYLNRPTEESDKTTYQTVYSRIKGSVAAPTAGLHFTDEVLDGLRRQGAIIGG